MSPPSSIIIGASTPPSYITPASALRDPGGRHPPETSLGPSGARGGPGRPPPGFVDLTADADTEDEQKDDAPASPSPDVSDGDDMDTDKDEDLLAYHGINRDPDVDVLVKLTYL